MGRSLGPKQTRRRHIYVYIYIYICGDVAFVCGPDYPPPKKRVIGDGSMDFPKDGPIQLG